MKRYGDKKTKRVLVDVTIEVDPPLIHFFNGNMEQLAANYEAWAKEFEDFVRDHRSQDPVSLTINRVYEERCIFCNRVYEEDHEGPLCCNDALNKWEDSKKEAAEATGDGTSG